MPADGASPPPPLRRPTGEVLEELTAGAGSHGPRAAALGLAALPPSMPRPLVMSPDISAPDVAQRFAVTVPERCCNAHGTLHGGVATWLLRTASCVHAAAAAGCAAASLATVELQVSFLKGAKKGQRLWVLSWCRRLGRSIGFLDAAIVDPGDPTAHLVRATHVLSLPGGVSKL